MLAPTSCNILSAHQLVHQILKLVERAESHVVLVTAYLDPWPGLEHVLRQAIARGVVVQVITRSIDNTHNDRQRRTKAVESVRRIGVTVHELDRLHAKLYSSEQEMILTSLNLTAGGLDHPNVGVRLPGSVWAMLAVKLIQQWLPGFSPSGSDGAGQGRIGA